MRLEMVFKINNISIKEHIKVGSYEVNAEDIYKSWTDGNYREHRDYKGYRVVGKCSLLFSDMRDFEAFLELMEVARVSTGGWYDCEVSVNNRLGTHRGQFFIDFAPALEDDASSQEKVAEFELTIRER